MMFSTAQHTSQLIELEEAKRRRQSRAAFGSIMRRHADVLDSSSVADRAMWLTSIGMPLSYMTEIAKEVSLYRYEASRA